MEKILNSLKILNNIKQLKACHHFTLYKPIMAEYTLNCILEMSMRVLTNVVTFYRSRSIASRQFPNVCRVALYSLVVWIQITRTHVSFEYLHNCIAFRLPLNLCMAPKLAK